MQWPVSVAWRERLVPKVLAAWHRLKRAWTPAMLTARAACWTQVAVAALATAVEQTARQESTAVRPAVQQKSTAASTLEVQELAVREDLTPVALPRRMRRSARVSSRTAAA
jgi:hypothetical protein